MNALFLLIPTAFVILAMAVGIFFWAVRNGQYDDLDTEGHRILFDDDKKSKKIHARKIKSSQSHD